MVFLFVRGSLTGFDFSRGIFTINGDARVFEVLGKGGSRDRYVRCLWFHGPFVFSYMN